MSGRELSGFFELVESAGCVRVPASALLKRSTVGAIAALRAEGVLEDGRAAETLRCPEEALCDRLVRDTWDAASGPRDPARRYLAICQLGRSQCDDEWVAESAVRTMHIRLEALQRMILRLLAVRPCPARLPRARAFGERPEPLRIGAQDRLGRKGATRDVFLSLRPRDELTRSWLALRERGMRGALVIVPTLRRLEEEVVATCTPIDDVEILALDEALTVRDGVVAASAKPLALEAARASNDAGAPGPAAKAKPTRHQPLRKTRGLELPPIRTWRDLRVCLIDVNTVRLDGGGKYARFTALDLGLASRTTHKPTRAWAVLAMTCDHGGAFTYTKFEKRFTVARKQVSLLGLKLQALFGIDEPPFQEPWGGVYRSKFIARVGVPAAAPGEVVGEE